MIPIKPIRHLKHANGRIVIEYEYGITLYVYPFTNATQYFITKNARSYKERDILSKWVSNA